MGLPEYDAVRIILENDEDLAGHSAGLELLDPATATLWMAGKEFFRDQVCGRDGLLLYLRENDPLCVVPMCGALLMLHPCFCTYRNG